MQQGEKFDFLDVVGTLRRRGKHKKTVRNNIKALNLKWIKT